MSGSLVGGARSSFPKPVPSPPAPFDALDDELPIGFEFFRVHGASRSGTAFNPGIGERTRFAWFGDPVVPWLYGAATRPAAVSETILHDLDPGVSFVVPSNYRDRAISRIVVKRPLRLASLHGTGARRLDVIAGDVTATDPSEYGKTVVWAEAAHDAGFDGLSYMSKQCNSDKAFILFGDRVVDTDLEIDDAETLAFGDFGDGLAMLVDICAPMRIGVLAR